MEVKVTSLIIFLWSMILCYTSVNASKVYKLRSLYRAYYKTDCTLLRVEMDSNGRPTSVTTKGHCCDEDKHTDLKVVLSSTNRGLEATFQWSHDSRYYLTAKTTGSPIVLEKPGSTITNNQRFVLKASPLCRNCVTVKSVATGKYMASTKDGKFFMTTNRKLHSTFFHLRTCNPALVMLCGFLDLSCSK